MARVTIVFEDKGTGAVKVEATPNFETMARKVNSGEGLTSAEAYAMNALNSVRKAAKEQAGKMKILIPRIGR